MELILLTIIVVGISFLLLSFNIIIKKNGKFPDTEIGHNREMRALGLSCAKSQERALWRVKKGVVQEESCKSCSCCSSDE